MDPANPPPARTPRPDAPARAGAGPAMLTGRVFSAILGDDAPERAALLDATAAALARLGVRVARVGNPLRAPLTLERMLIQLGVGEDGGPPAAEGTGVAEALRARRGGDGSGVVLVVEQAETLEPRALLHLQAVADAAGPAEPAFRVLFVGTPAFLALLDHAGAQHIRSEVATGWDGAPVGHGTPNGIVASVPTPDEAASAARPEVPRAANRPRARGILRGGARPGRRLALAALFLGAAAGAAVLGAAKLSREHPPVEGASAVTARPSQAAPTGQVPATAAQVPALAPAPSPEAAAGPAPLPVLPASPPSPGAAPQAPLSAYEEQRARLQREFDAFLDSSGHPGARLDAAQRRALFEEFLDWRAHDPAAGNDGAPPTAPPPARRVVVYHRAGSAAGAAEAGRVAEALRPGTEGVEIRALDGDPSAAPTVRYFYPEDAATARAVIRSVRALDEGRGWQARDSSKDPLKPPPGTVEVWLPTR